MVTRIREDVTRQMGRTGEGDGVAGGIKVYGGVTSLASSTK